MNKNHWKIKLLTWYCKKVLHVPIIINFTPDHMEEMYGIGLAWSHGAANRMRGDEMLLEKLSAANKINNALAGSRKGRRVLNRAAKRAVKGKK